MWEEQTEVAREPPYLFYRTQSQENPRIKQVNSLIFIHPNIWTSIWKFEKVEFYKYHAYMIYTNKGMLLDKVLCDVIPCACPLIHT
jgi:hypothetical protein